MQEVGRERAMFPGKWKLIGVSELVLSSAKCRSSTWSNKYTNETYATFLFTDFFLSIPHEQVEGYTFCAIWVNSEFECRKNEPQGPLTVIWEGVSGFVKAPCEYRPG